ncbi:unnamed protein product, partial [Meganyctiphanes norvegica]
MLPYRNFFPLKIGHGEGDFNFAGFDYGAFLNFYFIFSLFDIETINLMVQFRSQREKVLEVKSCVAPKTTPNYIGEGDGLVLKKKQENPMRLPTIIHGYGDNRGFLLELSCHHQLIALYKHSAQTSGQISDKKLNFAYVMKIVRDILLISTFLVWLLLTFKKGVIVFCPPRLTSRHRGLSIRRRLSEAYGMVAPNVRRPSIRTDLLILRSKTSLNLTGVQQYTGDKKSRRDHYCVIQI